MNSDLGTLGVDLSDWLAALETAAAPAGQGDADHTAAQLADLWHVERPVVLRRLHKLQSAGRLIVGRRREPGLLDGVLRPTPVYRLKGADKVQGGGRAVPRGNRRSSAS